MLETARAHLTDALTYAGLPERYVLQEQRKGAEYPTGPVAYLYPYGGTLHYDGAHRTITRGNTTRRLWTGQGTLRLELYGSDVKQLDQLLEGLLTWLFDNPYTVGGDRLKFPSADITVSYLNEEGVLLAENGVILDFPVELGLYRNAAWQPITVVLEEVIEGGTGG